MSPVASSRAPLIGITADSSANDAGKGNREKLFFLPHRYCDAIESAGGLPIIGHWTIYGLGTEIIGVLGLAGILVLIGIRQRDRRKKVSRFTGSTMWQAYFVEAVIVGVLVCGFLIRGFKVANDTFEYAAWATPVSHGVGALLPAAANGPTWHAIITHHPAEPSAAAISSTTRRCSTARAGPASWPAGPAGSWPARPARACCRRRR